ncbi:MAG: PAS domain S-box protein [Pseudomonadota bacterium]
MTRSIKKQLGKAIMQKIDLSEISERVLNEILSTVETPIALLDGDGAILRFNAACETLTEYSEAEAVGRKVWDFLIFDDEIETVRMVFTRTCAEDLPTHYTNYWKTKSGRRRLLKWSNKTLRRATGEMDIVIASALDITDLKSVEHDLVEKQAFLQSIVDSSPVSIITADEDGRILTFSRQAEETFQYKAAAVVGKNVHILMPDPDRSRHDDYMHRFFSTGEKRIIGRARSVNALRSDGKQFPAVLHISEFINGRRIFVAFIEDASEQRQTERRLSETQLQLQHAGRIGAMGELATSIAHELNQPLTAAASLAGAVSLRLKKAECEKCDEAIALLDDVVSEIRRASEIIRQMRDFVSKRKTSKSLHNLNTIVEDAAALAVIGADAQGIEVKWNLSPDIADALLDRIQIQQVVTNLIRNAIDAMQHASVKTLSISTKQVGECLSVSIEDTGPGVDDDLKDEIFEPFVSRKEDGMGVGLSISKSIIDAHQGEIHAANLKSGGSAFTFTLPAETEESVGGES